MTYAPYDNQQYSRKSHDESASSTQFLYDDLSQEVQRLITQPNTILNGKTRERSFFILNVSFHRLLHFLRPSRTKLGLVLIWLLVLWWGERRVFKSSIEGCQWDLWEAWVCHQNAFSLCKETDGSNSSLLTLFLTTSSFLPIPNSLILIHIPVDLGHCLHSLYGIPTCICEGHFLPCSRH